MAHRRIGLDPLAAKYLKLGANRHEMEYLAAPSEKIPLDDFECDAVFSFNSLDHVEDVNKSISEIKRVTKPGGIFLLLVEINQPPTDCEPHQLTAKTLISALQPEFDLTSLSAYEATEQGLYRAIKNNKRIENAEETTDVAWLSASFQKWK